MQTATSSGSQAHLTIEGFSSRQKPVQSGFTAAEGEPVPKGSKPD